MRERDAQQATIVRLEHAERALQAQLLELQTVSAVHAREAQVVTRTIADLQAHVARLSEKLAFYKDGVAQGAPPIGLRVGRGAARERPAGTSLPPPFCPCCGPTDPMAS